MNIKYQVTKRSTRVIGIVASMLLMMPIHVQAHTHLEQSTPAANSVGVAPKQVTLRFAHPVMVTALSIQSEDSDYLQKLGPLSDSATAIITLPAPALKPGKYLINWRAVGEDGHIMSGVIHFVVSAP